MKENGNPAWLEAVQPIRKEISQRYLEKARRALDAGLYDAVVNYTWDITIADLRTKVEAYGVDLFLSAEEDVKYHADAATLQDRWTHVPDSRLLSGAAKLNLISRTAMRHLSHWLGVRNHESAAHPVEEEEEIDAATAISCARECVKYVLSRDMPEPGFSIGVLAQSIKKHDLQADALEVQEQLKRLTTEQCDTALNMVVSLYIGGTPDVKVNVGAIIETLWSRATDNGRAKVGQKYGRLAGEGKSDEKAELLSLLISVDGVGQIPIHLRGALFRKAAQDLTDAHFGWDNYSKETGPARQLAELGVDCPDEQLSIFAAAFLVSFMGNFYGVAKGAQQHLTALTQKFSLRHWKALLDAVRNSDQVQSKLSHQKPYKRLQELCTKMLPFLVSAKDKEDCEFIIASDQYRALERFAAD